MQLAVCYCVNFNNRILSDTLISLKCMNLSYSMISTYCLGYFLFLFVPVSMSHMLFFWRTVLLCGTIWYEKGLMFMLWYHRWAIHFIGVVPILFMVGILPTVISVVFHYL